jgi:hypothetical protein
MQCISIFFPLSFTSLFIIVRQTHYYNHVFSLCLFLHILMYICILGHVCICVYTFIF